MWILPVILRPTVPGRERTLADMLAQWQQATLAAQDIPAAEQADAAAAALALPGRLAALQLEAPKSADRLPLQAEARLFATLPIHPEQRRGEAPAIRGALRFHIVAAQQEMERGFEPAAPLPAGLSAAAYTLFNH